MTALIHDKRTGIVRAVQCERVIVGTWWISLYNANGVCLRCLFKGEARLAGTTY